jgi:RNA polymerase sigma factor (sigma-70 family)
MNDSAAQAQCFEQHRAAVYGWAYSVLASHHDALDVTQDVAMKWWGLPAANRPANPRGWLRRVTINRAVDLVRGRRRVTHGVPVLPAARQPDALEAAELRDAVAAALAVLTDAQGAVLIAKVYDNLTFDQIAKEQELAVSTVKTHYLRALAGVRDRLKNQADFTGRMS